MPSNENAQAIMAAIATDRSKVLGVVIGDKKIEPPGFYIPRGEARALPEISFPVPNPSARYIIVSMDFDAPYPSWPFFGPVLHWVQANLVPISSSSAQEGDFVTLGMEEGSVGCIARYLSPNPPPGSTPHRYGFYLYEQPDGFDAARWAPDADGNMGNWTRIRFGLDEWEKEAGLGAMLAANYFTSN
ncbi:hypothetical protein LMH87_002838 [Akanthomyces muscarius]|uniref:Phosphatidylethanolamine-binding protein n=1 Tax=Akanthomyces muscarius TaxID=2231603 RepID=A0A9W8Q7M2_AKAMU|nr:hypothetical protein LMH87_002838 [Akanthomyces muscarius]KAJ4148363.1 hypothetical protein LMH87_002838 [Akanthomyces muscarius]